MSRTAIARFPHQNGVLGQRLPDALGDRAMCLPRHQQGIDGYAVVVDSRIAIQGRDHTGQFWIDFDFGKS